MEMKTIYYVFGICKINVHLMFSMHDISYSEHNNGFTFSITVQLLISQDNVLLCTQHNCSL